MTRAFELFEAITRRAHLIDSRSSSRPSDRLHPFDERNIHPEIAKVSQRLFDDGHYSQATFEAFKYLDKQVSGISGVNDSGFKLMMSAFNEQKPKIKLSNLSNISEIDEQKGFSFIFAGSASAIRNPRGHEVGNHDTIDQCLDHLCLASFLLRKLSDRLAP